MISRPPQRFSGIQTQKFVGLFCVLFFIASFSTANAFGFPNSINGSPHFTSNFDTLPKIFLLADSSSETFSERLWRTIRLEDYNTRIVMMGTILLGACAGVIGTFMVLRQRALVGDVVGHAALPGIAIAFLVLEACSPGMGKSVPGLLLGAFITGVMGIVATLLFRKIPRIKDDAAQAIVLSGFFGLGIALFTAIQNIPNGNAAGLNEFIFGKAASMLAADVWLIAAVSFVLLLITSLLMKEMTILCFDESYAAARGWPVNILDLVLMGLVVSVCVIGMQSVGMLLVVALLIIPPASARFWTNHLYHMVLTSALIGATSSCAGVVLSSLYPKLAAGAIIVLCGTILFTFSLLFGKERGVLHRFLVNSRLQKKVGQQDLLRAVYECIEWGLTDEQRGQKDFFCNQTVSRQKLQRKRSWSKRRLTKLISRATSESLITISKQETIQLTTKGMNSACRVVWNHRMWEAFLMQHAEIASASVDRAADRIEHILEPALIQELEHTLATNPAIFPIMPSPHVINSPTA